ncbi:Gfo/Idh/MocA family protein [Cohnella cellulosilytica]|uniref:Gfo/Idh/MocA family protein n=1 Tax=Cohnella cellulosilytica TaxID=986710 RepID=A0ABW2FD66_9BACL
MTLKVALVGAGEFAKIHLEAYRRNPHAEVAWICDPNLEAARKYAAEYGVPNVTADYEQALQDDRVAIVDITAPNYLHKPMSIRSMQAGKAVLCEKPMALNTAECEEMAQASADTGSKLFVKYHQRFDPVHQRAKQMMEQGQFPNPIMALVTLYGNHLPSMLNAKHWRGNPALCGGGCLFSSGSHVLDLIHYFFGDLHAITAVTRQLAANDPDKGDDNATVVMEFKSGVVVNLVGCWTTDQWTWEKEFHSTQGSLFIYQDENKANCLQLKKQGRAETLLVQPDWFNQSNYAAIDHFIDYVNDLTVPMYTLEECIRSMRTLEMAYRSSNEERRILADGAFVHG